MNEKQKKRAIFIRVSNKGRWSIKRKGNDKGIREWPAVHTKQNLGIDFERKSGCHCAWTSTVVCKLDVRVLEGIDPRGPEFLNWR